MGKMQRKPPRMYQTENIYSSDFPGKAFPLVVLANGKPGFTINQWIYYLMEEDITPALLEQRIRGVMHLYEFHYCTYGEQELTQKQSERLVADFLDAKKQGSEMMGWSPNNNRSTLKCYLDSINLFDKWQATFHNSIRMNPSEERFMSDWERYRDFVQRTKWDPMLHLFPSRTHMKTKHEHNLRITHKRFLVGKKTIPKSFPIERFIELVEHTPNPRDQMLFLIMGGGSLRQSETLHLFYQDVLGVNNMGTTRIRLDDPEIGKIDWDVSGKIKTGTRTQYLAECYANEKLKDTVPDLYRLAPRTKCKRGGYHAGFKGMTFSTDGENTVRADGRIEYWHEMFWCDPRFGIRFQKAYEEYVQENFHGKSTNWPYHPYLFINLERKTYGMPMTLGAVSGVWKRALKRIGMGNCGLGAHSLRHMYGAYCASVLKLPLETVSMMLHHSTTESTKIYYHLRSKDVRDAINKAIADNAGTQIMDYLIMPDTPRLLVPESWSE